MSSMRTVIYVLGRSRGDIACVVLLPFITLSEDIRTYVTWAFWISFVALLVALYLNYRNEPGSDEVQIEGPGFARFLFNNGPPACSGCRSACSSASPGSTPAGTS